MWVEYNVNPTGKSVGDCVIRALSAVMEKEWEETFLDVCLQGLVMCDMPSANAVWGAYLRRNGYRRKTVPEDCPDCYTVEDFCRDHPQGRYILALSGHVVAAIDGDWYDTENSGNDNPVYYWEKG